MTMNDRFEVRWTDKKGYGVFARKTIPSYATIVKERPILTIKATTAGPAAFDACVEAAFEKLRKGDQTKVLQLHEGSHLQAKTKVTRIFHANALGDEDEERLYLTASRVNHSCVPNASFHDDGGRVRSDRKIEAGKEITISYLPPFSHFMTNQQRATVLQLRYGFKCRCVACWPPEQSWISDARRQLMGFLSHALKGQQAPDFAEYNSIFTTTLANWPPQPTPNWRVLTPNQEIEYNFLLANLREAEGMTDNLVAECYLEAATKLSKRQSKMQSHPATKDIMFLEAARCIQEWYRAGIQLDEKFYGPTHERTRDGKRFRSKVVPQIPCVQVLRLSTLNRPGSKASKGSTRMENAFAAITVDEDVTMEGFSQEETAALIWRRLHRRRD